MNEHILIGKHTFRQKLSFTAMGTPFSKSLGGGGKDVVEDVVVFAADSKLHSTLITLRF